MLQWLAVESMAIDISAPQRNAMLVWTVNKNFDKKHNLASMRISLQKQ